jgi:hypothetical protein
MRALRGTPFRFVTLPSIADIQWAKGSVNRRTMHADRRLVSEYNPVRRRRRGAPLLMRLELIHTLPMRRRNDKACE